MIVVPSTDEQVVWCHQFYRTCGLCVSTGAQWLMWSTDGMPQWVIAFDAFMGTTCQLFMANQRPSPYPRSLIRAVFHHGFKVLGMTHIFASVDSKDESVVKFDKWLGFKEIHRVYDAWGAAGGDIVVLEIRPEDYHYG